MNWKQLIHDIASTGMTQAEIASKSGLVQSAISDLATGKTEEPRYSIGQRLIELRKKQLAKKRKEQ